MVQINATHSSGSGQGPRGNIPFGHDTARAKERSQERLLRTRSAAKDTGRRVTRRERSIKPRSEAAGAEKRGARRRLPESQADGGAVCPSPLFVWVKKEF